MFCHLTQHNNNNNNYIRHLYAHLEVFDKLTLSWTGGARLHTLEMMEKIVQVLILRR